MSFVQPRGRHRAPGKISTSLNSTARVSGAVAIGGGLVASAVFAQSAQAAGGPAPKAAAAAKASVTLTQVAGKHAAKVVAAPAAGSQIHDAVAVSTRISSVAAKTYVAPVAVAQTHATTSVRTSRSAVRQTPRPSSSGSGTTEPVSAPTQNVPAATGGVIAIAERYLGVPYVYGGSTPSGFDCSGFTSYVYRQLGVSLPRTAAAQQSAVTRVSTPQPGDLVFFGSPAHHIGIYLGTGMMIAAPQAGDRVKIQPIYDTPSGYGRP